jgi:phosphoribosyl-AMP cyclohydrolase
MTTDPLAASAAVPRGSKSEIEEGTAFTPLFDADGLLPAIVSDAATGEVLMFAHMNRAALDLTLATGFAHFYSRSRRRLWKKGEDSGNTLRLVALATDCDQDVVWLRVAVEGTGAACHTGRRSCFYRTVVRDGAGDTVAPRLALSSEAPLFDPATVYRPKGE